MNFLQKIVLIVLIIISTIYVYFSFFKQKENSIENHNSVNQFINNTQEKENVATNKNDELQKTVKIFILDKTGKLRSVNRTCDMKAKNSCFAYAINELVKAPSKWEKSKGFTSEIPLGTKVLSVRESSNCIMIDLSSNCETGGGAESTYYRVKQIIKTANANTNLPTYLYINGKQANVIGGEGIMIKQPLSERSFDE